MACFRDGQNWQIPQMRKGACSVRRAVLTVDLTDAEIAMIMASDIAPEHRYEIEDIPDYDKARSRKKAVAPKRAASKATSK